MSSVKSNTNGFYMPMLRPWVPQWLGIPLYMLTVLCFQFSCGMYLGAIEAVRGTTALMLEDMVYLLYTGLAGMAVMFPMLFRMKFRFTNQQLLCGAAAVVGICNFITMRTTNMAVLIPVCFLSGMAKLQGTFEVMSNIQLWHNPERDMGRFFPFLHIFLLTSIVGSAWVAAVIAYHLSWQMMHVFTIVTMCLVILIQQVFCQPFCPMPQRMPLRGVDWLSALLICVTMLLVSAIFVYGDHLMWLRSRQLRIALGLAVVFLALILYRMRTLERPYVSPQLFRYRNFLPILLVVMLAELLLGAEHSLEEILYGEVMRLEEHTKTQHDLISLLGVYAGIFLCFVWFRNQTQPPTIGRRTIGTWKVWHLLAVDFACIFVYGLLMYTRIDVLTPFEYYHPAMIFRGAATAITGIALMWSLHEVVHEFDHFFMALFVFNIIHMYLGGAEGYGLYTTLFKHHLADNMFRYDSMNMPAMMAVSIKQIYGYVCWAALFLTSAFLLLDIPRVRTGLHKLPYWPVYAIQYLTRKR